jgi:hypothetical protein
MEEIDDCSASKMNHGTIGGEFLLMTPHTTFFNCSSLCLPKKSRCKSIFSANQGENVGKSVKMELVDQLSIFPCQ